MQPQPFTRRYASDAEYSSDAEQLTASGWRVSSIYREPTGAIVATYATYAVTISPQQRPGLHPAVIVVGVIGLAIVLCCLAPFLATVLSSTHNQSAVTLAPTDTPEPTFAPYIAPTATPVATPTEAQRYDAIAQQHCRFYPSETTSQWDVAHSAVLVTVKVGPQWDINALHTTVENIVFDCFKAYYTASGTADVRSVQVNVQGPITDAYGNNSMGTYGAANLTRATARPFNWENLDYLSAWNNAIYDSQWERNY